MGLFYFPSNFVYWQKVKDHDIMKIKLLAEIEKTCHKPESNHDYRDPDMFNTTTNYWKNGVKEFLTDQTMIKNIVWDPLDRAINELNSGRNTPKIDFNNSRLLSSWYTYYKAGGVFDYHIHLDNEGTIIDNELYVCSFSLIYILKDENSENATTFLEPTNNRISTMSNIQNYFNTSDIDDIKEGCVIIFPSSLYHKVKPVKIPGRITIALNVISRVD